LGYNNFHLYFFDAATGKKIGVLEEVKDNLDTGAGAIGAQWSKDSRFVTITFRIDRREFASVRYRIGKRPGLFPEKPLNELGLPVFPESVLMNTCPRSSSF
jgi:hypothetical protein